MHGRQRIIQAAANILLGKPWGLRPVYPIDQVKERIFRNRPTPLWQPEVPAICLYTLTDTGDDRGGQEPSFYDRKVRLIAEVIVAATLGGDKLVDDIAEIVERLLLQSRFLPDPAFTYTAPDVKTNYLDRPELDPANTASNFKYLDTEIVFVGERVENVVSSCRIAFEPTFEYDPRVTGPSGIFNTMDVEYEGSAPAHDTKTGIYN